MELSLGLEQRQRLIMTPMLRQAMAILQLPALELNTFLRQEVLNNPLLEMQEEATDSDEGGPPEEDAEWMEYFSDSSDLGLNWGERREHRAPLFSQGLSLQEHLSFQLQLSPLTGVDREIGEFLIGCLDGNGYLQCGLDEVAARFAVSLPQVASVLKVLQGFDPPGVGARDLSECLLLQLDSLGEGENKLVRLLITEGLEDLAAGRYQRLATFLQVPLARLQEAIDVIRRLDPKPGSRFAGARETGYLTSDVTVERVNGEYVILVNDTIFPRLRLSRYYHRLLEKGLEVEPQVRRYLQEKLKAGLFILKSIEQRRLTLYRVCECVVRFQRDFFDHGVNRLKPLTLREVAEEIGLHESTVSRATTGKYMQTPWGLFELKFFFSGGLQREEGPSVSSRSVKRMIKGMVESEDARHPLSDQQIAERLQASGIDISRRTVAKYRIEAQIPPSNRRKRFT
ncbi:MAG: RNA polymerase factor sigma-54 [Firmicutes bacterium]|nr:RNA polymerase factor sigma-54 [Bacillota bacterium]MCL5039378.1 RNA polymerase factor sigma-54 [Bacillota bacterium]